MAEMESIVSKGFESGVTSGHGVFRMMVTKCDKDTVTGVIIDPTKELEELFPGGLITVRRCNASFK